MAGRYYIETYGCSLSEFDSLTMESILSSKGYLKVDDPGEADYLIVNTCSVRLDTELRIADRLRELAKAYPGKKLIVSGCLVKSRPGLVSRIVPNASLLSPQNSARILEAVESLDRGSRLVLLEGLRDTSWMPLPPVQDRVATIMVQEGCLGDCSFCISKVARRQVKSFPPRLVVDTVKKLVERGAVEIRLTGLDTAVYGVDLPGKPSLADLVSVILDKVEGDYRIRVGMMTPDQAMRFMDDLLQVYRDERVYKYFHLPVQSGDDRVLEYMNREYTVSEFVELHSKIKRAFPDSMIATDIIVGHPGEDEEAFQNTVKLVRKLRFEKVHLAQYSLRPHTKAAAMPQIPDSVKKRRSRILMRHIEEIGHEINSRYLGEVVEGYAVEKAFRNGYMVIRLDNYTPVIVPYEESLLGRRLRARVFHATFFDLRGQVVN